MLLATALPGGAETNNIAPRLQSLEEGIGHTDAKLSRQLNELLWFQRLGDVAHVDKIRFAAPPPPDTNGIASSPGSNDVIISAMTFLPRDRPMTRKIPLVVFAHGEIHGNLVTDEEAVIIRSPALRRNTLDTLRDGGRP